jgi:hypothetical protein
MLKGLTVSDRQGIPLYWTSRSGRHPGKYGSAKMLVRPEPIGNLQHPVDHAAGQMHKRKLSLLMHPTLKAYRASISYE